MATVDIYKIKVNVSGDKNVRGLQKDLNSLEGGLNKAGKSILALGAAAAAGFAAVGVSAFRMADAVADSANGLGIAIDRFYQISLAAEQSGISFDDAAKFMGKFAKSVDAATKGSQDMQDNFTKAGVSLEDLATLSDEALFNKVVTGLAEMGAGTDQTAASMGLLGKQARDLDFATFQEELKKNGEESKEAARLIKLGGEAADSLERAFRQLQVASLNVFEPIIKAIAEFDLKAKETQTTIKVLGGAMAAIGGAVLAANIVKLALAFKQVAGAVRAVVVGQTALTALMGPAGWAAIAGAVVATTAAVIALDAAMGDTADSTSDVVGATDELTEAEKKLAQEREISAGTDEIALQLAKDRIAVSQNNIALAKQALQESIKLIGVESNYANLQKANLTAEATAKKEIELIEALINQELVKNTTTSAEQVVLYKAQQDAIKANVEVSKELNALVYERLELEKQSANLTTFVNNLNQIAGTKAINTQKDVLAGKIAEGEISQRHADATLELFAMEKNHKTKIASLNQAIADLNANTDATAIASLQDQISLENQRYAESESNYKKELENAKDLRESTIAGTISAMEQLRASMEPFQLASDAVLSTWGNISSAIDDLVENGKINFGDLADSILKDLAKMIIKAMIFKYIFEPAMGFLGLDIPGKATGGPVAGNKPYMVGEKGPELFVPEGSGNIIPNHRLPTSGNSSPQAVQAAPTTNNYITNNISALDSKSVQQVFAENRQSLLGTVEYARKETSYGV